MRADHGHGRTRLAPGAPEPPAPERAAYLAASSSAVEAIRAAAAIGREQPSRDRSRRLLDAMRAITERQVEVLDSVDRLITRCEELGLRTAFVSRLRENRAEVEVRHRWAVAEVRRLESR